jgi:Ser/Thr protein kinase RdoA (MazF antagonist)
MMDLSKEISTRYGFSEPELRPLGEGNQQLIDVRFRHNGSERRAVLRIYFDWVDRKDVEAETTWLTSLATDTDLLVPHPIPALDGTFIQDLDLNSESKGSVAVMHTWVPGTALAENVTSEKIEEVGRVLACLHNHSALAMDRNSLPSHRQGFEVWVDDWSAAKGVAPDAETVLKTAADTVSSMFKSISKEAHLCGFIHCDPHPWNILIDGDHVAILDFSDCGFGPYAYDIASALVYYKYPWVWEKEPQFNYGKLEEALLEGYASERKVPENLEKALPVCFAARLLVLVQWILDDLEDIDATTWTRKSIVNSIDLLRQFCGENTDG